MRKFQDFNEEISTSEQHKDTREYKLKSLNDLFKGRRIREPWDSDSHWHHVTHLWSFPTLIQSGDTGPRV